MFSSKIAALFSTCSLGVGVLIGRKTLVSRDEALETRIHELYLDKSPYFFPTASAKSKSKKDVVEIDHLEDINLIDNLPNQKDNDNVNTTDKQTNYYQTVLSEMVKYGYPSYENVRSYEDFILSYDKRNRNANWVLEHLTPEKVERSDDVSRSSMKFVEDESFHEFHRATNKDFHGSGYDRGHLAAAANHRHSKSAMSQTFILSNVAPQVGEGFNRDAWNNLEKYTRALARRNKNVYVVTGPLYLPRKEDDGKVYVKYEVIGPNHVAVPTHFFKVLLIENVQGEKELMSFVMPNAPQPNIKLKHYLMPVETVERAAGLHFFDRIHKQNLIKVNTIPSKRTIT